MKRQHQHYALYESDKLIHIKDVDKDKKLVFRCPNCKQEMIARQGKIYDWHFAHKKKECEYDRYLHRLAEIKNREWYNSQQSIPLILRRLSVCAKLETCKWAQRNICKGSYEENINLKKWLSPTCEIEKEFIKDNKRFVADIFCPNIKNQNNPLFIEIYVTHKCEKEKLNSGIKIIEVKIENEQDIDFFINNPIQRSEKVKFHNFEFKGNGKPTDKLEVQIQKYILFLSGKSFVYYGGITCKNYDKRRGVFEVSMGKNPLISIKNKEVDFYEIAQAIAYRETGRIKHCNLCKFAHSDYFSGRKICALNKRFGTNLLCTDNDAYQCRYYSFDKERYNYILSSIKIIEDAGAIDIWKSTDWK